MTVPRRLWLLSPRDSDEAAVTATSAVTSLPASNVQTKDPRQVWRSGGTSGTLVFACTEAMAFNGLGANGLNRLTGDAQFRIRGAASVPGLGSPPVDTDWVDVFPDGKPSLKKWPQYGSMANWVNDTEYAYWSVELADPDNPLGYLDVGRLAFGRVWQPSWDFDQQSTPLSFDQRDVQAFTAYGTTLTDPRENSARRRFSLNLQALEVDEVEEGLSEIQRLAGMWGDIFVCLDPGATGGAFQRRFAQAVFTSQQGYTGIPYFTENGPMVSALLQLREV